MKLLESNLLGNMPLKNRLVMAPMCTYSVAKHDGIATARHFTHYAARAVGGVGLIIVEATAIEPAGKISDDDIGLYADNQVAALKSIVEEVHANGAKIAIQLNHAGRKCEATDGVEKIYAPSSLAFDTNARVPQELTIREIEDLVTKFVEAAKRADNAGFDAIEIHAAHGYLINQFLSPVSNKRTDKYGESHVFLEEILVAINKVWPSEKELWVRLSATDYEKDGYNVEETIEVVKKIQPLITCVNVSSGGVTPTPPQAIYPGYQVDFATKIKIATGLPVMTAGLLGSDELIGFILGSEKADYIALARPLLRNPNWLLDYANDHKGQEIIPSFLSRGFPRKR